MAHISTLGAARFTDLSVTTATVTEATFITFDENSDVSSYFDGAPNTGEYQRITNIKEFPAIGIPANVVKVPEYGSKTSKQIQGQADSPTMEITLNYIPSYWADGYLGGAATVANSGSPSVAAPQVADGKLRLFRFTLLDKEPAGYNATTNSIATSENSSYYFLGKIEALEVTPSLTDAMTAKLTITVQSSIKGAWTVN
jgi:hypothetical protein